MKAEKDGGQATRDMQSPTPDQLLTGGRGPELPIGTPANLPMINLHAPFTALFAMAKVNDLRGARLGNHQRPSDFQSSIQIPSLTDQTGWFIYILDRSRGGHRGWRCTSIDQSHLWQVGRHAQRLRHGHRQFPHLHGRVVKIRVSCSPDQYVDAVPGAARRPGEQVPKGAGFHHVLLRLL